MDPQWARRRQAWPILRAAVSITTALSLAPFLLAEIWRRHSLPRRLSRLVIAASLAVVAVTSAYYVTHYDELYETHDDFDVDEWFTQ